MKKCVKAAIIAMAAIFALSGCAGAATAPNPTNSAQAAILSNTGESPVAAPVVTPPAAPPAVGADVQKAVQDYLSLTGHNVPPNTPIVISAPAANKDHQFLAGQKCTMQWGGDVKPVQTVDGGVQVVYSYPHETSRIYCPDGTQFTTAQAQLDMMAAQAKAFDDVFTAELQRMAAIRIPPGPLPPAKFPAVKGVRLLNVVPLKDADGVSYTFWKSCLVGDLNSPQNSGKVSLIQPIEIAGKTESLVIYTNDSRPATNGQCPSGAIYAQYEEEGITLPDTRQDVPLLESYGFVGAN